MSGILDNKTILVAGVLNESSIAFAAAAEAQESGAEVMLTSYGRRASITRMVAKRLPRPARILEFDAESESDVDALSLELKKLPAQLDGVIHCISASRPTVVGPHFTTARWEDVEHSFRVSAYSYQALVRACEPHLRDGSSVVGCTVDATRAWPVYGWAGVAKAAYESTNQYMALHLGARGIRCNLVAAGPLSSATMRSIEGIDAIDEIWSARAPLPWDANDFKPVARTLTVLLSDWLPSTTGEVIHCDAGFHAAAY